MKLFFATSVLFIFAQSTTFGSCVNLTGTYKLNETTVSRYTQNSCVSLRIEFGNIRDNGRIEWYDVSIRSLLNGTPTCDTFGCVTGHADDKKIELSRDKEWLAYSAVHGACSYNQVIHRRSVNGGVVESQNVYGCEDGYSGWIELTLTPLK